MAKERKISSRPIRFFRAIWINVLESGEIELPKAFVKMLGKDLPKYAYFKVPTGEVTKMGLRMSEDRAWIHEGWQEFVDMYSIKCGYFLNFQYHGRSRFDVVIFNMRCTEVKYPRISSTKHEVCEDAIDDEISEVCPPKVQKGKGKMKNAKQSAQGKLSSADARERVLAKANSFRSPHPHFFITMKPTYVSGNAYLYVPVAPAKSYFPSRGDGRIRVRLNGKTWPMEYNVITSPRSVKIRVGWKEFSNGNGLQAGDVCAFELIDREREEFKITIFRIADEEEGLKAMSSGGAKFKIHMNLTYISRASVNIPSEHAKRYLKEDDELGEKVITLYGSNGGRWRVEYYHHCRFPGSRAKKVLLTKGWMDFVSDNRLNEEDVVVFEKMEGQAKAYKVTIFRLGDHA